MDPTGSGFDVMDVLNSKYGNQSQGDLVNALGGISADDEKRATLDQQMKMAALTRAGPQVNSKGTYIPGKGGGVYVGPSALQQAVQGTSYVLGNKQANDAIAQGQQLNTNEEQARQRMMAAIMKQNMNSGGEGVDPSQDSDVQAQGSAIPGLTMGGHAGNADPTSMGVPTPQQPQAPMSPQGAPQQPPNWMQGMSPEMMSFLQANGGSDADPTQQDPSQGALPGSRGRMWF